MKGDLADQLRTVLPEFNSDAEILSALLEKLKDKAFRIVNAGPLNPGKSTLFNALLEKKEVFKTADVRQTVCCQEEPWKENVILVDTPGCNAVNSEDYIVSLEAFRKADFLLFVHNVTTGSLTKAELEILKKIHEFYGDNDFKERVCIVCNRSDETSRSDAERNIAAILASLQEFFGIALPVFLVSPLLYLKGIDKNTSQKKSQFFIRESNMRELQAYLETSLKRLDIRGSECLKAVCQKLEKSKAEYSENLSNMREQVNSAKKNARNSWTMVLREIRPVWNRCCD